MDNIESHLGNIVNREMIKNQDSIFQIDFNSGQTENFREFRLRAICLAQYLSDNGCGVGDLIALCCDNHNDGTVPVISSTFLGTTLIPLHHLLTKVEFHHLFTLSKPKIVFADQSKATEIKEVLREIGNTCEIVVFGKGDEVPDGCIPFSRVIKRTGNEENFVIPDFNPKTTTAFALCSSGTTGLPKAVCLTHHNILVQIMPLLRLSNKDELSNGTVALWSSLYWLTGTITIFTSAMSGAKLVHGVCEFSAKLFYQIMDKYQPVLSLLSPAAVQMLVNDVDFSEHKFPSLKTLLTIGSPINPEFLKSFQANMPNGHVILCYGLTETSGTVSYAPVVKGKNNCVGTPSSNFEWKVVDADEKTLEPNEIGELRLKGPSLFKEYLGNSEATASAFDSDGFIRTGDLVYFDKDKDIFIVGRIKEMIKYRNFQVTPVELELLLREHEAVYDAAVVGVDSSSHGQVPMAFVELKAGSSATAKELIAHVDEQVADFKKLRGGIVLVEKLPLTPNGKLNRKAVNNMKLTAKAIFE